MSFLHSQYSCWIQTHIKTNSDEIGSLKEYIKNQYYG